jgi:hypothetical protein
MPNISLTLHETQQSVTRPVIFDIINQVQAITKIDTSTKVFFPGDQGKMQTPGSSIEPDAERYAIFNSDRYNFIEVEEDYDKNTLGSTAVTRREHIRVYEDAKLQTYIAPVYATSEVTINFKYRCPSKSEALRWRDDIRMRVSSLRDLNMHNITYHYLLPTEFLVVLTAIHENREATDGYEQTFDEYVTAYSTDRLTLISGITGQDARLAISETQTRIIGLYTFDGIPDKPEHEEDNGNWTSSFSYKFTYEKPIACNMKYPVMVHNKLLPEYLVSFTDKAYDIDRVSKSYTTSLYALSGFEYDTIMNSKMKPNFTLKIPAFDDFYTDQFVKATGTILMALSEVDTDKRTLLNLNELGDIILDTDILQFILESEVPYIAIPYQSIISVSLYRNEYLTSGSSLVCTDTLDIKATSDLNLRNQHRVRLALVTDISLLSREALLRLMKYPKALVKIIAAINELLRQHPDLLKLIGKSSISINDFNVIYWLLTGKEFAVNNGIKTSLGSSNNINQWPFNGSSQSNLSRTNSRKLSEMQMAKFGTEASFREAKANGTLNNLNWNKLGIFGDIDPSLVEEYRRNRLGNNTVQISGIISILEPR